MAALCLKLAIKQVKLPATVLPHRLITLHVAFGSGHH